MVLSHHVQVLERIFTLHVAGMSGNPFPKADAMSECQQRLQIRNHLVCKRTLNHLPKLF